MKMTSWKGIFVGLLLISAMGKPSYAENNDDSWLWWGAKTAAKVAVGAGAVVGTIAAAPVVLTAAGFGAAGIAAGSIAAGLQGSALISGSAFAVLQSAGAGGIGAGTSALLGTVAGAVGYKAAKAVVDDDEDDIDD